MTATAVTLSPRQLRTRRAFDLVIGFGVLGGLPVWLLLMLAIVVDSRGPVFYWQTRVSKDGAEFGIYKFRSMYHDADACLRGLKPHNERAARSSR